MSGGGSGPNGGQNVLTQLLGGSNPMANAAQQGQSVSPQAGGPVGPQPQQGAPQSPMQPNPAQNPQTQTGNNPYQAFLTALQQIQSVNPATNVQAVTPPVAPSSANQRVGKNGSINGLGVG